MSQEIYPIFSTKLIISLRKTTSNKESKMEKQIKINSLNIINHHIATLKGNVELVKQVTGLTDTKEIMATLLVVEKMAVKMTDRFAKKVAKVESKPKKERKAKAAKEEIITEAIVLMPSTDLSVEHLATV